MSLESHVFYNLFLRFTYIGSPDSKILYFIGKVLLTKFTNKQKHFYGGIFGCGFKYRLTFLLSSVQIVM